MDLKYLPYIIIIFLGITGLVIFIFFLLKNKMKIFNIIPIARETIVDSIKDNIIVLDNKNRILYLNPSAQNIFKCLNINFVGKPITELLPDYYNYLNNKADNPELSVEIVLLRKNHKRDYDMIVSPIIYSKEKLIGKVVALRDITEQKQINKSLNFRIKFENLITTLSTNFIRLSSDEIDDEINYALKTVGKFTSISRIYIFLFHNHGSRINKTYEWCAEDTEPKIKELKGISTENIPGWLEKLKKFEPVYIPDVSKIEPKSKEEKKILKSQGIKSIVIIPMAHGETLTGFLGFESIKIKKLWTINDITLLKLFGEILANALERKKAEEEIRYLSLKDKLTGLYNRTYFEEELKRLNTKRQLPLSFIMGDVNGLKLINDAFGPKEGDKLLRRIARILKSCCRKEDIIARWGGDEFSILLPKTTERDSEEILKRIRGSCLETDDQKIPLSISLGTSTKKNYNCDIRTIIKEAEDWMYRRKLLERKSICSSIISSLERTLQEKSYETEEHALRMKEMSLVLGNSLKLRENKLNELSLLSALHDIGKIAIPDEILMKKGKLTDEEWIIIKRHPEVGYNISGSSPHLVPIADAVLSHHEWWNGAGYPRGLRGEDIPLTSRIISIIDAYDVMTHDRSYKKAVSRQDALEELRRCAGTQFDPSLIEIFTQL